MIPHHATILVVDDHDGMRSFVSEVITMLGHRPVVCGEAANAPDMIRREHPDMVIFDLHLEQKYAGWYLLNNLRKTDETASIPAVLCTSDDRFVRSHRGAVEAQGAEVLLKPFAPDELIDMIESTVGQEA